MIKVDSVSDYRQKLTELNLPIFQKGKTKPPTDSIPEKKERKVSQDESASNWNQIYRNLRVEEKDGWEKVETEGLAYPQTQEWCWMGQKGGRKEEKKIA